MLSYLVPLIAANCVGLCYLTVSILMYLYCTYFSPLLASHLVPKPAASAMDLNQSHPQGMLSKEEFLKLKEAAWKKEL